MNAINKPNEVSMFKEFFEGQILVDTRDNKSGLHKVEIGTSPQTKCVKIFSPDMSHSYWTYSGYYRAADKEEIAAGHRIDLETLRDCDTSPNCKKFDERVK